MIPQAQFAQMTGRAAKVWTRHRKALEEAGFQPGTVGHSRAAYNLLDFAEDAPELVGRFVQKLPEVLKQGATIEAFGDARASAFYDEQQNQWNYDQNLFPTYADLRKDQRLRAAGFDYQGQIG